MSGYEGNIKKFRGDSWLQIYSRYPNLFIKAKSTDMLEVSAKNDCPVFSRYSSALIPFRSFIAENQKEAAVKSLYELIIDYVSINNLDKA